MNIIIPDQMELPKQVKILSDNYLSF